MYTKMIDFGGTGTSAYELSTFTALRSKPKKVSSLEVVKKNVAARQLQRAKGRALVAAVAAMAILLVVGVLIAMLASRAVLTELNVQIAAAQQELTESIAENIGMKTKLEAKLSMRTIEEYASQNLGMTPLDKSQITYVNLSGGEKVERNLEDVLGEGNILLNLLRQIQEYVSGK